jgi:hypothetical protein
MKHYFQLIFPVIFLLSSTLFASPTRTSLVDTGYDACLITGGINCENNKNLLFRGNQPLDENKQYAYDPDAFRSLIFSYLTAFEKNTITNAPLPRTLAELENYRIVIINLLYDAKDEGSDEEYNELTYEFSHHNATTAQIVPEQHKMYDLTQPFRANEYAFEWWPIILDSDLNWPNQEKILVPRSTQFYKPMDYAYLLSGSVYAGDSENEAMDLLHLLTMQPADGHPLLIFYHCAAGKDRTGSLTLAYLMQHGGYANITKPAGWKQTALTRNRPLSFHDALEATTNMQYPSPNAAALKTGKAYCLSLKGNVGGCGE